MLRHIVLIAFKPGTAAAEIARTEAAFAALPAQIGSVRSFEWGTDVSPENLAQGYTHAFVLGFDDEAGRDAYLPHPAHEAFVAGLKPVLDKVLVLDFHVHAASTKG